MITPTRLHLYMAAQHYILQSIMAVITGYRPSIDYSRAARVILNLMTQYLNCPYPTEPKVVKRESPNVESEEGGEYEIERIIHHDSKGRFCVKWKGYEEDMKDELNWVNKEDLQQAPDALQDYLSDD